MERLEQPPGASRSSASLRSLRRKDENDWVFNPMDGISTHPLSMEPLRYKTLHGLKPFYPLIITIENWVHGALLIPQKMQSSIPLALQIQSDSKHNRP